MSSQAAPDRAQINCPIASVGHFCVMLLIQLALVAVGFWLQHKSGPGSVVPAKHNILPLYFSVMALEWGWWRPCAGLSMTKAFGCATSSAAGGAVGKTLPATRLSPFLVAGEGAVRLMHRLLGPDQAKSINSLLPQSILEIAVWIAVSLTAGICEEIVFRGYFQKQLAAYTGSVTGGVLLQAVIFGLAHSYQGVKQVVIICVLGVLYGCFAAWRRSLRSNMIAHAGTDIWSGWLSRVFS